MATEPHLLFPAFYEAYRLIGHPDSSADPDDDVSQATFADCLAHCPSTIDPTQVELWLSPMSTIQRHAMANKVPLLHVPKTQGDIMLEQFVKYLQGEE